MSDFMVVKISHFSLFTNYFSHFSLALEVSFWKQEGLLSTFWRFEPLVKTGNGFLSALPLPSGRRQAGARLVKCSFEVDMILL
jgi:hypothetical protein